MSDRSDELMASRHVAEIRCHVKVASDSNILLPIMQILFYTSLHLPSNVHYKCIYVKFFFFFFFFCW